MDPEDLKWSFRNIGIGLNDQEIKVLLANFDTKNSGKVDYRMLVESLNVESDKLGGHRS